MARRCQSPKMLTHAEAHPGGGLCSDPPQQLHLVLVLGVCISWRTFDLGLIFHHCIVEGQDGDTIDDLHSVPTARVLWTY
jgi:hypothetical protein